MARPVTTSAAGEEKPAQSKRRAEHHAELLMGLAEQRKYEQSLAEHHAKEIGDIDAYSLAEFCRRHSISIQMYYKLAQQGLAPVTFNVGTRVLVSKEAPARWRAEREEAGAAKATKAAAAAAASGTVKPINSDISA